MIAQLVEVTDLNPVKCEFESRSWHLAVVQVERTGDFGVSLAQVRVLTAGFGNVTQVDRDVNAARNILKIAMGLHSLGERP